MTDPQKIQNDATYVVLHAWITTYSRTPNTGANLATVSEQFQSQAVRLRESALHLAAALEKMRLANERLAARMAEHKAFFAKYQAPDKS